MDAQKNPKVARQGATDALNQNIMARSFVGGADISALGKAVLKVKGMRK